MKQRDTITKTVRVNQDAWTKFVSRCREVGATPNAALVGFISSPQLTIKPLVARASRKDTRKPIGFDPVTDEPIYSRGVGPRGGKK